VSSSTGLVPLHPSGLVPLAPFEDYLVYERLPAVVDATALINDSLRYLRIGREPLLIGFARQPRLVNLFATSDVLAEVETRLPKAAARRGFSPAAAVSVWREELRPLVSFVDVSPLQPSDDPRLAALARRDASDVPTAVLAELLAPCLVFASDNDLVNLGIARRDWANLLLQARDVTTHRDSVSLTVIGALVLAATGWELGRGVVTAARRWPLPTIIASIVGGYLLHAYWQSQRGVGQRREARSLAADAGRELAAFLDRAVEARMLLERAAFVPDGEPTPLAGVARLVAVAPRSLLPGEIAPRVGFSHQRVTSVLQEPIFERTSEGLYLLGRLGTGRSVGEHSAAVCSDQSSTGGNVLPHERPHR
jgi:hypothetical protein